MSQSLILFGAGASFGSDTQGTPPIGEALFDALAKFSPSTWGSIHPGEAASFRNEFEQGMRAYTGVHATDGTVDRLQRAMAAFFFSFCPGPNNLYRRFARWTHRLGWNGAMASLNYERLLELSLLGEGLNVIGEPSPNYIELCHPHGCCHLFINMKVEGPIVLGSMNLKMEHSGPPVPINDGAEFHQRICTDQLPPVMCYFEPGKDARCGLSFINEQRARFAALVGSASVVAIVGVKVRRHDRHLWEPLARTPARLVYCGGEISACEFEYWAKGCGRSGDRAVPALWCDGFDEICSALMT